MRSTKILALTLAFPILLVPDATAQTPAGTADDPPGACRASARYTATGLATHSATYLAAAEVTGRAPLAPNLIRRPSRVRARPVCDDGGALPWRRRAEPAPPGVVVVSAEVRILPATLHAEVNTAYPRDRNNGALWAGRGLSTGLIGGVEARWGPLSVAIAPELYHQMNRRFDLVEVSAPGHSPLIYPWHRARIDWPQRFGTEPFWTLDPGQSYARLEGYGLTAGVSNESLWWGPAIRNPILLSNTAPGFPHAFLGTAHPIDIRIGRLEAEAVWGRLRESDYFDNDPTNDRRLFAGLILDFEPRWLPGLFLGAARIHTETLPADGLSLTEQAIRPYRDVKSNPQGPVGGDNQIISLFGRWVHPRSGFETYFEWAREDHWLDVKSLLMMPDASQAYTLGFRKVVETGSKWVHLYGELTHLQDALPILYAGRGVLTYYTHSQVRQGHTHRGQLLGAAIGPGSDAQTLGVDVFHDKGLIGGAIERVRYDADAYYAIWTQYYGPHGYDVEYTGSVHQLLFIRNLDVKWGVAFSYRYNRNYLGLDGSNWDFQSERNWNFRLGVTWRPEPRPTDPAPEPPVTAPEGR